MKKSAFSNLLSIGEFSKISGVSIKSLRYYDRLGVLRPAYVNEDNGYRYYRLKQMYLLDSIIFCIDTGIPLRKLKNYLSSDGSTIHYERLFADGKSQAAKKIAQINQKLQLLEYVQMDIQRSSSLKSTPTKVYFERAAFILLPFDSSENDVYSSDVVKDSLLALAKKNIPVIHDVGIIAFFRDGHTEKNFIVPVEPGYEDNINDANMVIMPAGVYSCVKSGSGDIDRAKDIFNLENSHNAIIIEMESYSPSYNLNSPEYELRCIVLDESADIPVKL